MKTKKVLYGNLKDGQEFSYGKESFIRINSMLAQAIDVDGKFTYRLSFGIGEMVEIEVKE